MFSSRPFISLHKAITGFPPLQGSHNIDTCESAGWFEPCTLDVGLLNVLSDFLTIFQPD